MKAVSYNGITFDSLNVKAGIPDDMPGPEVSANVIERYGTTPLHAGLSRGVRSIPVVFRVKPGYTVETTLMTLLAKLDPDDETERVLAAKLNDNTDVYVYAALGSWTYLSVDTVQVLFYASEPTWKKTSRRYSPGAAATDYTSFTANGSLTVQNDGQVSALPVVRLKWSGTNRSSGETSYLGWKYRRRVTVTNSSTRTLRRYPIRLDLNDTAAWVTAGKALANGNDIRILANGVDLPRTLLYHNTAITTGTVAAGTTRQAIEVSGTPYSSNEHAGRMLVIRSGDLKGETAEITSNDSNTLTLETRLSAVPANGVTFAIRNCYAWVILDELAAGEAVNLDVIYGNPSAGAATELTTLPNIPAFDLLRSSNQTWTYNMKRARSSTTGSGLWWTAPIGAAPDRVSWDTPGAWYRISYLDNRDDRTQARSTKVASTEYTTASGGSTTTAKIGTSPWTTDQWKSHRIRFTSGANSGATRIITGNTSDTLTFSPEVGSSVGSGQKFVVDWNIGMFDAQRTWRDNARYPEEGAYDAVAFSHPLGIKSITGTYRITNPVGIAKFILGSRTSGSEDWTLDIQDDTSRFTEATGVSLNTDWSSGNEPIQIVLALSSGNDAEIPADYARDSGQASSGGTATLTDGTKNWTTDQWKNGRIRIIGGKGAGQGRDVASNTDSQITTKTNWSTTPNENSRYIVTADHKASAAIDSNAITLVIKTGQLTVSDISDPETEVYDLGGGTGTNRLLLRMGGGSGATTYPYDRVWIGGPNQRVLLASGEYLQIDAANRTVRLYASGGGSYTSVPWCAQFERLYQERGVTRTALTAEWLPVRAADSKLYITQAAWGGSSVGLNADLEEAFIG